MTSLSVSNQIKDCYYKSIAEHRNSKRIWLDNARLENLGFAHGTHIRISHDLQRQQVAIVPDQKAQKIVAGRRKNGAVKPIIDYMNRELAPAGSRIRVLMMPNLIIITLHHEDQARWDRELRLREVAAGRKVMTEGTLCAGIGVSTLAAHEALSQSGIISRVQWMIDIEQKYLDIAASNNSAVTPETQLICGALEEVETDLLSKVDFMSVSLPCTGFSPSGRSRNKLRFGEEHATAATAVFGFMQIVKHSNPAVIVSENVKEAKDSATYSLIKGELKRLGYELEEVILDGNDAGTLENRTRYFLIAVSKGLVSEFSFSSLVPQARIYERMGDIEDRVPEDEWRTFPYLEEKEKRDIAAGKGFRRQFFNNESKSIGCITRGYAKIRSTDPMWIREDGLQRPLTAKEHAKAKLIPVDLIKGVSKTLAHEGLGQSVLFPHVTMLVEQIASGVRNLAPSIH